MGIAVWTTMVRRLRAPKILNLRADPFEEAQSRLSTTGVDRAHRVFMFVPALAMVAR